MLITFIEHLYAKLITLHPLSYFVFKITLCTFNLIGEKTETVYLLDCDSTVLQNWHLNPTLPNSLMHFTSVNVLMLKQQTF